MERKPNLIPKTITKVGAWCTWLDTLNYGYGNAVWILAKWKLSQWQMLSLWLSQLSLHFHSPEPSASPGEYLVSVFLWPQIY